MRLLRKHTDFSKAKVIVIDNNSADASLAYLRSLSWIKLIERKPNKNETGVQSHAEALDMGLIEVKTPYVLSIHTDTFVKHNDWLKILLAPFRSNPRLAGVGSWKLESKNAIQRFGVHFEQAWKKYLHDNFGYQRYNAKRLDESQYYLRSHCAMYRTSIIRELNTSFFDGETTAGKVMHEKMVQAGYDMRFLESAELGQYVDHLNHATAILNPNLGASKKNMKEGGRRIKKILREIDANKVLSDTFLDH